MDTLRHRVPWFFNYCSGYLDTVTGTDIISLPKAKLNGLKYVKLFGGTEQRNLPSEYTQVEYLESSGTQYIDPQVTGDARWVITAQANAVKGSSQALISSTPSASGGSWYGEFTTTGKWDVVSGGTNIPVTTKTTADLTFDGDGAHGTIGSTSVNRAVTVTQGNWILLKTEDGSYPFSGKLFDAKVYQNGALVRNFIPAKNSSNVIGMYDLVSGQFFTNAGTGTFTAGADVTTPSPDYPIDIVCNNGVIRLNNVHNIATDTLGGYINKSTGAIASNDGYGYTDYIPVTAGQVFKITQRGSSTTDADGIAEYDSNKVWQRSQSINALGGTYTVPSGISYIRPNFNINYQQFVIENGIYTEGPKRYGPVGYTVVGSPTITDGVVTDLTYENYLLLDQTPDLTKPFRIRVKFTTKSTASANWSSYHLVVGGSKYVFGPRYDNKITLSLSNGSTQLVSNTTVATDRTYTAEYVYGADKTLSIYVDSGEGLKLDSTFENVNTPSLSSSDKALLGHWNYSGSAGPASIDLKDTFMSINGQPYFGSYNEDVTETVEVFGKNLFDGQWQVGIYNTSTGIYNSSATNRICNVDMILIKPLTDYTVSCPSYVLANGMKWLFYDKNKNFISAITTGATTITTPSNAKYINFYIANDLTVATAPDLQLELGSTATTYEPYYNGGTATAQDLLAVSTFGKDVQEVISGTVTKNIGVKVLDGTETWEAHNTWYWANILPSLSGDVSARLLCTHFVNQGPTNDLSIHRDTSDSTYLQISYNAMADAAALKSWLAAQYAAGTPVIVLYCKATSTETVTGQPLSIKSGTNIIEITQAAMTGLGLEAKYKRSK